EQVVAAAANDGLVRGVVAGDRVGEGGADDRVERGRVGQHESQTAGAGLVDALRAGSQQVQANGAVECGEVQNVAGRGFVEHVAAEVAALEDEGVLAAAARDEVV